MIEKPAITEQAIDKVLAERWSGRFYDSTQAVSEEQIIQLCEAARWAPSCYGEQPWRFIIFNRHQNENAWTQALNCLSPGNQEWAQNAPLLIIATSNTEFSHNNTPNRWAAYDTGAASISLCLQASAMGLMSHQMGGFDSNQTRQSFNLPDNVECWAIIAIGYPAPLDTLDETQLERELKIRERRPLSDNFFIDSWDKPLTSGENK